MAVKRLNVELSLEHYEVLRDEARKRNQPVVAIIRELIGSLAKKKGKAKPSEYTEDPWYLRRGSFEGQANLAEEHDRYIYGEDE